MMLSNDGLKFIVSFEGKLKDLGDGRYQAYQCVVGHKNGKPVYDGKWTIYAGVTEGVTEGMIVTEAEGEEMFRRELSKFEAAVNRLVKVPISQNAFDALVSFSYNCGEGALAKSSLLKKLNAGDHEGAAHEFGFWVNSNGVKNVPGLVRRRREEAAMFLRPDKAEMVVLATIKPDNGISNYQVPSMPQTVDAPAPVASAAKSSRTVFGGLAGLAAVVGGFFKDSIAVVIDAAGQIDMLSPATKVASALGITTERTMFALGIASILLVLYARFDDAQKGNVK